MAEARKVCKQMAEQYEHVDLECPASHSGEISDGMAASTEEVEAAIRADFAAMPAFAQQRMMELLAKADPVLQVDCERTKLLA